MINDKTGYAGIFLTIVFTVYSQVIIKWQVSIAGDLPEDFYGKVHFLTLLLLKPWVLSAITCTFAAGVSWMVAMSKFDIGFAYPFVSIVYVLVLASGILFFDESLTLNKVLGIAIIITGIIVLSRG